ncbi:LysM peptidoglycan-binding domain-containing protein, partial [Deltaproteobacteria bacterium OttesenSCG-928-M10]|nr:LysM peptidoglycan-binding domain-containing protein [Deltaproteobacteria bacterium OttesenSCG-928-M10]
MCGSSADKLAELNPHLRKGAIPPNESNFVLRIPAGSTGKFAKAYGKSGQGRGTAEAAHQHIAQKGETVESVAALYMIEADQLRQINNLSGSNLKEGTKLTLPPQSAIASAKPLDRKAKPVSVAQVPAAASPRLSSITHKVKTGDTLGSIAKRYGVSIDSIKKNNNLTGTTVKTGQILKIKSDLPLTAEAKSSSPLMVVESKAPPRVEGTHTVVAGESLGVIAKKYGMSVKELADINGLKGVTINIGQKLKVSRPGGPADGPRQTPAAKSEPERAGRSGDQIHTVQSGDSLGALAQKYGSSSKAIMEANNLPDHNIRIGQKLNIPGRGPASPAPAAAPAKSGSGEAGVHVVQSGESLSVIAQKYGLATKALAEMNNITDNNIRIGQKLKVSGGKPAGRTASQTGGGAGVYTVATGDTIYGIAKKHNLSVADLKKLNNLG